MPSIDFSAPIETAEQAASLLEHFQEHLAENETMKNERLWLHIQANSPTPFKVPMVLSLRSQGVLQEILLKEKGTIAFDAPIHGQQEASDLLKHFPRNLAEGKTMKAEHLWLTLQANDPIPFKAPMVLSQHTQRVLKKYQAAVQQDLRKQAATPTQTPIKPAVSQNHKPSLSAQKPQPAKRSKIDDAFGALMGSKVAEYAFGAFFILGVIIAVLHLLSAVLTGGDIPGWVRP